MNNCTWFSMPFADLSKLAMMDEAVLATVISDIDAYADMGIVSSSVFSDNQKQQRIAASVYASMAAAIDDARDRCELKSQNGVINRIAGKERADYKKAHPGCTEAEANAVYEDARNQAAGNMTAGQAATKAYCEARGFDYVRLQKSGITTTAYGEGVTQAELNRRIDEFFTAKN